MSKYVIHTCNERQWYVQEYLIPSMTAQGIAAADINIWLDSKEIGNLDACMQCFKSMPNNEDGTWHMQDDVLIASNFKQKTEEFDGAMPIVCGFCFNTPALITPAGEQNGEGMWYSFQCIYIQNKIARECGEWFFNKAKGNQRYSYYVANRKFDDTMFKIFIKERFGAQKIALNLTPTLVEHIDDLIGGSVINQDRNLDSAARGIGFPQPQLVNYLRIQLENRGKRVVVYAGTRNLYFRMPAAIRSLLIHTDVDKIYLLIEDDEFPWPLPPEVEVKNVSNQQWFKEDCPNIHNPWGYMVLLRAAYSEIFWQYDKILSLDIDTIVVDDISGLWDIDLDGYYLAGVREPQKSEGGKEYRTPLYINCGIAMHNLKKLRDGTAARIIQLLNTKHYQFSEQDCFNEYCSGKIKELPPEYNDTSPYRDIYQITEPTDHPKIIHYAAIADYTTYPEFKKYAQMRITDGKNEY